MLRVGVLGAGPIAQAAHLEAAVKARNAELYALCDAAPDLLATVAAIHRPRVTYASFDAMLADGDVDAVVIAVGDQFHVPMSLRALAAGKHVLVEKPMGVTVEECAALVDAVEASGLVLQVGHMRRFDEGIAAARSFDLGERLAYRGWYCDSVHRYAMTDALQPSIVRSEAAVRPPKPDPDTYALRAHASHLIDTARFLCGDIVSTRARLVKKYGARAWFIECEFADGALGHLELVMSVRDDWREGFVIDGSRGAVRGRCFQPWYLRTSEVECFADGVSTRPLGPDGHFYRRQLEGFADAVAGGPQVGATAADGLAVARVLADIERSLAS